MRIIAKRSFPIKAFFSGLWFLCLTIPGSSLGPSGASTSYYCQPGQYERALDTQFDRTLENDHAVVRVRILRSFQPEEEIILVGPESTPSVLYLVFERSAWRQMQFPARPSDSECLRAAEVPVQVKRIAMTSEHATEFLKLLSTIDMHSDQCLRKTNGACAYLADGTTYQVSIPKDRVRQKVTDTSGTDLQSENPALLRWALAFRQAVLQR